MSKQTGIRLKKIADEIFDGNKSNMARAIGMSPQAANKYFQGEREPGFKMLERLVSIDVNATWVIKGTPPMLYSHLELHPEVQKLESEGLEKINQRVKYVRVFYKKTITEMAMLMGCSPKTQIAVENGEKEVWIEYSNRIKNHFPDIREDWLKGGEEPKLHSRPSEDTTVHPIEEESAEDEGDSISAQLKDIINRDLSTAESQLLSEVEAFSKFLESRNLNPQVKRLLVQLLIQSIDQELERRQRAQVQSSED